MTLADASLTPPTLRVAGLDVTYGRRDAVVPAVRDVSFDVGRGEIFGLVGESGSGKSSVCSALLRLLPRSATFRADELRLDGIDLAALGERDMRRVRGRRVALVPQHPMAALTPTVPIGRQLRWYLGDDLGGSELVEALGAIGLGPVLERLDELPDRFSGGELQRLVVAIAAFAHRPTLLVADEPTSSLDATVRVQVLRELLDVRARLGLSILFVSHDLGVVAQICDRVAVMHEGRIVECAPVDELFAAPSHEQTQQLLASA